MYALSLIFLPAVLAAQVRLTYPWIILQCRNQFSHFGFQVPQFVPPSEGPLVASSNYVGANNGSLPKAEVVSGKAFNRFIQVGVCSLTTPHWLPVLI